MEAARVDLSDFITALLSHDISNFNQTSRGYLEMLLAEQMGELTADQFRALTICLRQTNRIQHLIDSARLVVELTTSEVAMRPQDLDLAVRGAIVEVENEFSDREVRVRFEERGRMALCEGFLVNLMRQLLSNGARFNDSDVVEITVAITEEDDPAPMWRVMVADNGSGIPPKRCDSLFDRVQTREVHGSGLGLSLAKTLVQRWGGRIWLERSSETEGTEIGLTIPRIALAP